MQFFAPFWGLFYFVEAFFKLKQTELLQMRFFLRICNSPFFAF
jgi:hypothetical protein